MHTATDYCFESESMYWIYFFCALFCSSILQSNYLIYAFPSSIYLWFSLTDCESPALFRCAQRPAMPIEHTTDDGKEKEKSKMMNAILAQCGSRSMHTIIVIYHLVFFFLSFRSFSFARCCSQDNVWSFEQRLFSSIHCTIIIFKRARERERILSHSCLRRFKRLRHTFLFLFDVFC